MARSKNKDQSITQSNNASSIGNKRGMARRAAGYWLTIYEVQKFEVDKLDLQLVFDNRSAKLIERLSIP